MIFPQVIAALHAVFDVIGLPGNLLVLVTIALEKRLRIFRHFLLASLAASDFLFLILVNSFRAVSIAQERRQYSEKMCHLGSCFVRFFYINTVLHLVAVSYERYHAIVKSPLTYNGTITKFRALLIALIWIIPIPFSIGPYLGFGKYVYNPEVFFCEHEWSTKGDQTARNIMIFLLCTLVVPLLVIVLLNRSVLKEVKRLVNAVQVQVGSLDGSESPQQETSSRLREWKAAVDVCIIVGAFLLCFLPGWFVGVFRQFTSFKVPAEAILTTYCLFMGSSMCNPIIYSIRKRDFRTGVKNLLRRTGVCQSSNDIGNDEIGMGNLRIDANCRIQASRTVATLSTQQQRMEDSIGDMRRARVTFQSRLSPVSEIPESD